MNLKELLERNKDKNTVAIKESDTVITYDEWYKSAIKVSTIISMHTTESARNVAIFIPNSINYAIAYFGILFANKVIIPINTKAKYPEIFSTLKYCEVDLIITTSDLLETFKGYINLYLNRINVYCIDENKEISFNEDKQYVDKSFTPVFNNNDDDVAIMLHTSGTTSNPKRVMLTHSNLINNVESNILSLGLTNDDKVLITLPMCFGYCNTAQFLTHLYLGAQIFIYTGMFMPKKIFETIQNEKITNMTVVPSMLLMLLEYRYKEKYSIQSLRYICFGGSKMPEEKLLMLIESFPKVDFVQTYGQTEASPRTTMLEAEYTITKLGSIGKPIPNVNVKIVDNNDIEVNPNIIGEIVIAGKNVMKGYYKQDELTKQTIRNGWLHTGDLGYVDEDGFFYITGRMKNIIISGGINIYPEEIEEILLNYQGIEDAYVTSEAHPILGEVPIATIVAHNNEYLDINKVRTYCKEKLADYKIPYRFETVKEIEKTYNGKIKRNKGVL